MIGVLRSENQFPAPHSMQEAGRLLGAAVKLALQTFPTPACFATPEGWVSFHKLPAGSRETALAPGHSLLRRWLLSCSPCCWIHCTKLTLPYWWQLGLPAMFQRGWADNGCSRLFVSVYLFACLFVCLLVCLSVWLCLFACLSVAVRLLVCVCRSICLYSSCFLVVFLTYF